VEVIFRRAVSIFNFPENFSFCGHDGVSLQTKPVIKGTKHIVSYSTQAFKLVEVVALDQKNGRNDPGYFLFPVIQNSVR